MKQKRSGMNKISPVGLATTALVANQVSVLATYNEKLCRPYCVNGSVQPQTSITYSYEQPILKAQRCLCLSWRQSPSFRL